VSDLGFVSRFLFLTVLGGLACLSSGCGDGTPSLTPVSGKVTVNEKPLTSGSVIYYPNSAKGNKFGGLSVGEINAQGEYTLQTNGKPGAPVGAYKVTVSSTGAVTPDNTKPTIKSPVNQQFALPETTPLQVEVVEKAAPGAYDLKVGS